MELIKHKDKYYIKTNTGYNEVLSTTNKSLTVDLGHLYLDHIPQLSEQSIKLLIDYYNREDKMPDEVEVKMDDNWDKRVAKFPEGFGDGYEEFIKLNPRGEVDIAIPEEKCSKRCKHFEKNDTDSICFICNSNYDMFEPKKQSTEDNTFGSCKDVEKKTYTKEEVESLIIKFKGDNFKHLNMGIVELNEWFNKNL